MRALFGLLLAICSSAVSQASTLSLSLNKQHLSERQVNWATSLLDQAQELLPNSVKKSLPRALEVKFQLLSGRHATGRAEINKNRIVLTSEYLRLADQVASDNPSVINGRKLDQKTALVSLLHEVAHFYDLENLEDPDLTRIRYKCELGKQSDQNRPNEDSICGRILAKHTTVSGSPQFLALTDWDPSSQKTQLLNEYDGRMVDAQGKSDPKETFAILFAHFLADPDFVCRLPSVHSYFERKSEVRHRPKSCQNELHWLNLSNVSNRYTEISRDRVYKIDFLWASEGKEAMSRLGHAMFRLVICAPERKTIGPECYADQKHHLVLTFGAASNTLAFEKMAGLTGKYPMNLHVESFLAARVLYNVAGGRDLYALPLNLTKSEQSQLLEHLYRIHWGYEGKYYFLTRNCATESVRALIAAMTNMEDALGLFTARPDELMYKLLNSSLSRYKTLEALKEEKNLYFQSSAPLVDKALAFVNTAFGTKLRSGNEYESVFSVAKLAPLLAQTQAFDNRTLTAFLYLEQSRYEKAKVMLIAEMMKADLERRNKILEAALADKHANYRARFPGAMLPSTEYGIPTSAEASQAFASVQGGLDQVSKYDVSVLSSEPLAEAMAKLTEHHNLIKQIKLSLNTN